MGIVRCKSGSEKILRPRALLNIHVSLARRLARMSAPRFVRGVFGTSRPPHGILQACAVRALPAASLLLAFSALAQPEYLPVPPAAKPLSAGAPSQGASSPQGLLTINSSSLQRAYNVDLESGKLEIVE